MKLTRIGFGGVGMGARGVWLAAGAVVMACGSAWGQLDLGLASGVAGSAGVFNPTSSVTIDLSLATTGAWDQAGDQNGTYDPAEWMVVFHYSEVNIPAGVTVDFANHPSGAPVVWVVDGDVTIDGVVNVSGGVGATAGGVPFFSEPGPGGFRGGPQAELASPASPGFGPGGASVGDGDSAGGGGSYATAGGSGNCGGGVGGPTYGNEFVVPLIGGSGGSGGDNGGAVINDGGGAGGGAILIVCRDAFALGGSIFANGGNDGFGNNRNGGGGSGGAIRVVADVVGGPGILQAVGGSAGGNNCIGGSGGLGRIRVEANSVDLSTSGEPVYSLGVPASPVLIMPPSDAPSVRVVSIAEAAAPSDPVGDLTFPNADIEFDSDGPAVVQIETMNVPGDATVRVRVAPRVGQPYFVDAVFVGGNTKLATWEAEVDFANGFGAVQVRAILPTNEG